MTWTHMTMILLIGCTAFLTAECFSEETPQPVSPYGFRHDIGAYAKNAKTLDAAKIRTFLLKAPRKGDKAIIAKRVDAIFARQNKDGSFTNKPVQETGGMLLELAGLGIKRNHPKAKQAIDWLLGGEKTRIDSYGLEALVRLGVKDHPRVKAAAKKEIDEVIKATGYPGCPWSPIVQIRSLWVAREVLSKEDREKAEQVIVKGLNWILREMNDAGCVGHKDPWGFVDLAGAVSHPLTRQIVCRQIPLILRGQQNDGGFKQHSFKSFRALHSHNLIDSLSSLPPLPPDWKIVYEIKAPSTRLSSMTHDGEDLWVLKPDSNEVFEVFPVDGKVTTLLTIPTKGIKFIGWNGTSLLASKPGTKQILTIDTSNGKITKVETVSKVHWLGQATKINNKIWMADLWMPCIWTSSPKSPAKLAYFQPAGPLPLHFCQCGDAIWQLDGWAPLMIKTGLDRKLKDWAEIPFEGKCSGIAWDGEHLWALDPEKQRICIIQRQIHKRRRVFKVHQPAPAKPDKKENKKDGKPQQKTEALPKKTNGKPTPAKPDKQEASKAAKPLQKTDKRPLQANPKQPPLKPDNK